MEREKFATLVGKAVSHFPEEFQAKLENIDVVVSDRPSRRQLARLGLPPGHTLLGLYEGVPLTRRGVSYGLVPPDKITIFQKPVEATCQGEVRIIAGIEAVVRHEIAHHFGISDARLEQIDRDST